MIKQTFCTAFAIFVIATASAKAQDYDFLGLEFKAAAGTMIPLVDGQFEKTWSIGDGVNTKLPSSRAGVFVWYLSNDVTRGDNRWSEVYAGPTFVPRKGIEIQIGVGIDSTQAARIGGGVYMNGHFGNGMVTMEQGGSGLWYKGAYTHHVLGPVAFGFFTQRFADTGPLVELKVSKTYALWFSAGPNLENRQFATITGLNIKLP